MTPPSPPVYHHEIGLKLAGGQYEKVIVYAGTCFVAAAAVTAAGWVVERKAIWSILAGVDLGGFTFFR